MADASEIYATVADEVADRLDRKVVPNWNDLTGSQQSSLVAEWEMLVDDAMGEFARRASLLIHEEAS